MAVNHRSNIPNKSGRLRRSSVALVLGLALVMLAAACSSDDSPELSSLPETESTVAPSASENPEPEQVAVGPAVVEVEVILLPDGRILDDDGQLAAQAYIEYYRQRDAGGLTEAEAGNLASASALDALLYAAADGVEGDGSTTTVGITNARAEGSSVILSTCDVADLGENSLLDDGTRLTDYRAHRVTVDLTADGARVSEVARLTSAIQEGRFCADVAQQRLLISQVFSAFEVYSDVAAGDAEVGELDDVYVDPILSFLKDRIEASPGQVVGPIQISSAQVTNWIPNFRGNVEMCLVYPDGIQVLDEDGVLVGSEAAGNELGFIASVTKTEPGEGEFEIVDMDFAPASPPC